MNLKGGGVYIINLARLVAILTMCLVASCSDSSKVKYPEVKGPWGNETDYEITDTGVGPLSNKFIWLDNDNLLFTAEKSLFFEDHSENKDGRVFVVWNQKKKEMYPMPGYDLSMRPSNYCHYQNGRLIVSFRDPTKKSKYLGGRHEFYEVYLGVEGGGYYVSSMSPIDYDPDKHIIRCGPRFHIVPRNDPSTKPIVYLDEVGGQVNWYLNGDSVYIDRKGNFSKLHTYSGRDEFQYVSWMDVYFYGAKNIDFNPDVGGRELISYLFTKDGVIEARYPEISSRSSGISACLTKKGMVYISIENRWVRRPEDYYGLYIRMEDGQISRLMRGNPKQLYPSSISPDGCRIAISHYNGSEKEKTLKIVDVCKQVGRVSM
ncbi:hypothetical protein QP938_09515 [Porticoccaceae bacterium LTM1]|nr:hypothetical protein QP938_09515 [Porticoccaceae bacterium LTM1]